MSTDEQIDFSLSQEDTYRLPHVVVTPGTQIPVLPRMPKKTRLERLPLSQTTATMMRIIRRSRPESLHEYFEQTCDQRQHATAVICGSYQLTYQELEQRANRLAHFLISRGVGKGKPIGILLERSLDMYITLLGVLKAGAAFVPLDPSFSSDLVAFITQDAGLQGIVTTSAFREKMSSLPCSVLELDRVCETISVQSETRPQIRVDPTSLCYIIYNFGTKDRPSGIAVSHTNIVNFLRVTTPIYGVRHNDRVYQGMPISSELSLAENWSAWIAGATLVAGPTSTLCVGHMLTEFLINYKITVLYCMPTLFATIERDVPSLRTLLIGGGVCPSNLVRLWSRVGRRMLSIYGFPETTITATWRELFPGRPVTMGSPLPTYQIYILDDQLHPVEDSKSGEICIGGPGVATGYLNCPDLTKQRFIPNPVLADCENVPRLYRTGDIGRFTPFGEIEYLGQIDSQLQVRGYSIESVEVGQEVFPSFNSAPLNRDDSVIQFEFGAGANVATERRKLKLFSQINFKNVYQHVMTDPLYKNSIFQMSSAFTLGAFGFVFWMIVARLFKTANVGIATTLISIMTLLCSFALLGLNSSLNRYVPKSINKNELINSAFFVVNLSTAIVSAGFLLGLRVFSPQLLFLRSNVIYIISFIIFVVFCNCNSIVESTFMAFRSAGYILIKNLIISTLKILLLFAFVILGSYGIFMANVVAISLGVLFALVILNMKFNMKFRFSINLHLLKETSAYSIANYISGFMLNAPSLVLPVIILNTISAEYAAYYYIASMIQNILQVIPLATAQSLLTEGAYSEIELKKHVKKALITISVILIPTITLVVFCGNILLQFFGKNYANQAFQFLQLYSVSTIFTSLILIANAIHNVKHRRKTLITLNVFAAVLTLWLSYAFASGKLVGIGWGWMLGQAIAGLVSLFFIIKVFAS